MLKRSSTNYMVLLFLVDLLIVQVALAWAMQLRFILPFGKDLRPFWGSDDVYLPTPSIHLAVGCLWAASLLFGSLYATRRVAFWFEELQRLLFSHTSATLCFAGLLYLIKVDLARLTFLYFYILVAASMIGARVLLRVWHQVKHSHGAGVTRILIVGAGKVGRELASRLARDHSSALTVVGFVDDACDKAGTRQAGVPVLARLDQTATTIKQHQVDEVIFALPLHAHVQLRNLVVALHDLPVRIHVVPDYFDLAFHAATIESLGGVPLIGLRDSAIDGFQRFTKRLMDLAISATALLLLWPIMLAAAIAIKIEDGGPILYRGSRVGENGRLFRMLKFRTMAVDADKLQHMLTERDDQGKVIFKRADDPRITRIGRLLRRTSIDELPQLFNVLRGEMSLVGPRPELPWLVEAYEPWQHKRFAVPQGITGWWQINGRSHNHLHTDQDIYYIQHYSLWLDIVILWRTVSAVIRGRGAY